jgi:hypothetical protein
VKDRFRRAGIDDAIEGVAIDDVDLMELGAVGNPSRVPRGEVVDHRDALTGGQQGVNEVRANKARSTCHDNASGRAHQIPLPETCAGVKTSNGKAISSGVERAVRSLSITTLPMRSVVQAVIIYCG